MSTQRVVVVALAITAAAFALVPWVAGHQRTAETSGQHRGELAALDATGQWQRVVTQTNSPSDRITDMVYEPARDTVVLFGGADIEDWSTVDGTKEIFGDTWLWDGSAWEQWTGESSPPARYVHAMAHDSARERTVLFSGGTVVDGAFTRFDDTWEWDGTSWTERHPEEHPSARCCAAMAYDAARGNIVLFGGTSNSGNVNDTWTWDGDTWTQRDSLNKPSRRTEPMMAYDAAREVVVLFGGGSSNETWEWNGERWSRRFPQRSPQGRSSGALDFDVSASRVVLFAGWRGLGTDYSDTWSWDGTNWERVTTADRPTSRAKHAMAYIPSQERTLMFGGFDRLRGQSLGDAWALTLDEPTPTPVPSDTPTPTPVPTRPPSWDAFLPALKSGAR